LTDELDSLFNQCHPAFSNHESWVKCRELMYGELTCLGRHTVTGMLAASGNQFVDWSGAYRLFSKQHGEGIRLGHISRPISSGANALSKCHLPSRVKGKSANQEPSPLISTIAQQLLDLGKRQKKNNGKRTKKKVIPIKKY